MKKKQYRIVATKKELELLHTLLQMEYEQLIDNNAAQSSKDFVGKLLDKIYYKLNSSKTQ